MGTISSPAIDAALEKSMQLCDLVKPISEMTDEELLEHLRQIKHRRTVERPAHRAHVERAETKTKRAKAKSTNKLIDKLSDAERAALIAELTKEG